MKREQENRDDLDEFLFGSIEDNDPTTILVGIITWFIIIIISIIFGCC